MRWLLLLALAGAAAHADSLDEDRLRAAFVLRLAQYTQWPQPLGDGSPLSLCVAGISSNGMDALRGLENRPMGSLQLKVRPLNDPREAARDCQVLLLGHADAASLRPWMTATADAPVLVMATSPEALRAGVCIALISEPQGMAFAVNHRESKRRGLSLAAPVLKLAREVR